MTRAPAFPHFEGVRPRPGHEFRLEPPLSVPPPAGARAQRRRHIAAACGTGRHPRCCSVAAMRSTPRWRRAIALTVVEPCSNGIGSDLFAILWDGPRADPGSCAPGRAPAAATAPSGTPASRRDSPARLGGGDDSRCRLGVGRAVATLRRVALRRPLRAGHTPWTGRLCGVAGRRAEKRAAARKVSPYDLGSAEHFRPAGRAVAGESVELSGDGANAGKHRRTHGRLLSGEPRRRWSRMRTRAARCTRSPTSPSTRWTGSSPWGDYVGPPWTRSTRTVKGIASVLALGIPARVRPASAAADSVASQHLQIEAMKAGLADAYRLVGDLRTTELPPSVLLDPTHRRVARALIDPKRAQDFGNGDPPRVARVYLCAADERGMMVSLIQSTIPGIGSGVVGRAPASAWRIAAPAFRRPVTRTRSAGGAAVPRPSSWISHGDGACSPRSA